MKWVFVGLAFLGSAAFAADPVYPKASVNGYFVRDFDNFSKLTLEPGILVKCTSSGSSGFFNYNCELDKTELTVEVNGKAHKIAFKTLNAYESAGSPTNPGMYSYYFVGKYSTSLPDGTPYEADASLTFSRNETTPDRLQGNLNIYALGINGGVVATFPPDPSTP